MGLKKNINPNLSMEVVGKVQKKPCIPKEEGEEL